MRRKIAIISLAAAMAGLDAATVPQRSADDYHFSRPNAPSNIVGVVMGDPPAYHLPRSEDVAWLREAWAERVALAGGSPFGNWWTGTLAQVVEEVPRFGRWPLAETNRFSAWVAASETTAGGGVATNVVVGYNWATNSGAGVDGPTIRGVSPYAGLEARLVANTERLDNGYLSPTDAVYVAQATAWGADARMETNVAVRTVWLDAWTNATSYVVMQMTNGTVSVVTNSWRAYAPTSTVIVVTNIYRVGTPLGIPSIFTNGVTHGLERPLPPPMQGLLSAAAITNHYASLKAARRLAKYAATTNALCQEIEGAYDGGSVETYTNSPAYMPSAYRACVSTEYKTYIPVWDDEDVDQATTPPDDWKLDSGRGGSQNFVLALGATIGFRIVMSASAAAPTGGVLSIRAARAYANVRMSYRETSMAATSLGGPGYHDEYATNVSSYATVPLGDVVPVLDQDGGAITFEAKLDESVLRDAWSAADFPVQLPETDTYVPRLRFTCPDGGHGELADSVWRGVSATRLVFEAEIINNIIVLLDVKPSTSLEGW